MGPRQSAAAGSGVGSTEPSRLERVGIDPSWLAPRCARASFRPTLAAPPRRCQLSRPGRPRNTPFGQTAEPVLEAPGPRGTWARSPPGSGAYLGQEPTWIRRLPGPAAYLGLPPGPQPKGAAKTPLLTRPIKSIRLHVAQAAPIVQRRVKPKPRRRLPSRRHRINGIGPVVSAMRRGRWDLRRCTIKFVGYRPRVWPKGRWWLTGALPQRAALFAG